MDLKKILEDHRKWLFGEEGGVRADLSGFKLCGSNLSRTILSKAILNNTDFSGANLSGAYISRADLHHANFQNAILCYAKIEEADLSYANLCGADLSHASLFSSDLTRANLTKTKFFNCDLGLIDVFGAIIDDTDFTGACFPRVDFRTAILNGCGIVGIPNHILEKMFPLVPPSDGQFIGWKKLRNERIACLRIECYAKRTSAFGRKCRTNKAFVMMITDENGNTFESGVSQYDIDFIYRVGEYVSVDNFDGNRWNECSSGIHFFVTKQEAIDY